MLNGLATTDLPLLVDAPARTLQPGEKICRHPDDGSEVDWRVVGHHPGEDGAVVVEYHLPDDAPGADPRTWTVTDPDDEDHWLTVEVGQVTR
ncbi:hypothetical protein [Actinomadura rubrisoli]|uniref:Uncharacterized protein n=1 Tax=Actinomadura rubrisoli TaxID=2530368 RepID=A0A4V2YZK3_9ACTN|nr:hypothetical protein [Actinomadura rubrisoli]TDD97577.1 hypothetical protein E1298_00675 [Actinomadura rubrisoli]